MNQPATARVVVDRFFKGHLPVTDLAVSDLGGVRIAVPDEYRSRLYHLMEISLDGGAKETGSFSMEKPSLTAISTDGNSLIASTDDKIYSFRDDEKTRLFPDRRNLYVDISISSSGNRFTASAGNLTASDHTVLFANTAGGEVWTKSLPYSISVSRISSDGNRILVGSDEGKAVLLNSSRHTVWQIDEIAPISSGAVTANGDLSILATKNGSIAAVSADGERIWQLDDLGYVKTCAIAASSGMAAAVHVGDNGNDRLAIYSEDGNPLLEYETVDHIRSVALSPSGRYVALSCEDGRLQILEIVVIPRQLSSEAHGRELFDEACAVAEEGEIVSSMRMFREGFELAPQDAEACLRFLRIRNAYVDAAVSDAEKSAANGDSEAAFELLRSAFDVDPYNRLLFERLISQRDALIRSLLEEAHSMTESGRSEEAVSSIMKILRLDTGSYEAREQLAQLKHDLADGFLHNAESALTSGDPEAGAEYLEKAFSCRPTLELHQRLLSARAAHTFSEGLQAYEEKNYSQSILLFKKVLSIDPENAEAAKYIEYAKRMRQDDSLQRRFGKLE